jgi:hypothetical protein
MVVDGSTTIIPFQLMTAQRRVSAMILETHYSFKCGFGRHWKMIIYFVFLVPSYFACTQSAILRDFVNSIWIAVPPLAKNNVYVLYIAREMALFARNVGIQYEIVGIPSFVIPKVV